MIEFSIETCFTLILEVHLVVYGVARVSSLSFRSRKFCHASSISMYNSAISKLGLLTVNQLHD
jgi:hypothetical protein